MKTRIISGAVGIIILAAVIIASLQIDKLIFLVMVSLVCAIGVYEALKPTGFVKSKLLLYSSLVYAVITPYILSFDVFVSKLELGFYIQPEVPTVLFAVVIFAAAMFKHKEIKPNEVTFCFAATVAITFAFWSLSSVFNHNDGLFYLIMIVIAAWGCDTGAYFTGYFFGKHKMAPEISPKKTVEGAVGGIVTDMLLMLLACIIFNNVTDSEANIITVLAITPVLALSGMIGDLIFSYIKRDCGIKDYGKIMPGHGGVLDRFDSVAVVAPLMYLAVSHFTLVG